MALGPGCRVGVPRLLGEGLRVSTLVPNCPWERWGAEPAGKSAQPLGYLIPARADTPGASAHPAATDRGQSQKAATCSHRGSTG